MKKKISSIILSLTLVFNIASVGVFAQDTDLTEITDVTTDATTDVISDSVDDISTEDTATIDDDDIAVNGRVLFPDSPFPSDLTNGKVVGKIIFTEVGDDDTEESDLTFQSASSTIFINTVTLDKDTKYNVSLKGADGFEYLDDYLISDIFQPTKSSDSSGISSQDFTATIISDKVSVSGYVTFISAESSDLEGKAPKLQFSADGQGTVTADLDIKNTREGHFENIELVKDVTYNVALTGIDSYELDSSLTYTVSETTTGKQFDAKKVVDYSENLVSLKGIVTFPEADFSDDDLENATIKFTTQNGIERTANLTRTGSTTADYMFSNNNQLFEIREYTVTIEGVEGYTLSTKCTTPSATAPDADKKADFTATAKNNNDGDDDDDNSDDNNDIVIPQPDTDDNDGTYGKVDGENVTLNKVEISNQPDGVTVEVDTIPTTGDGVTNTVINKVVLNQTSTKTETNGDEKIKTTIEYDAPMVMFNLSVFENDSDYTGDALNITVEFSPISLSSADSDTTTFLELFHFDNVGNADIISNATFQKNDNGEYISVTFSTNDFSPFAIAQGYSTVKITQTNSSSNSSSSSSNSSTTATVSAVGSDGTTYYITGNVPTVGFISQLRGVSVGEMVNLDKITVSGKEIIGWFYDRDFTKEVEKTSQFVITQDVMDNGVFPKFEVSVDTLGAGVYADGSTASNYNYNTNSSFVAPVLSSVPYTGVSLGARLF